MNLLKILGFLGFLTLSLWGRQEAEAVSACPAWNDLKETRNRGGLYLKPGETYRVQRHHKGHYLVRWSDGKSQRWVRETCLEPRKGRKTSRKTSKETVKESTLHSLLVLTWHNAFCETHPNRKECRPLYSQGNDHLVLHGLWPQPEEKVYCGISERDVEADRQKRWGALPAFKFPPDLQQFMIRYMPGIHSRLERHEWVKHGSCYDPDPLRYFDDALGLTEQVDRSLVGEYLRANKGRRVTLLQLRKLFERSFGKGTGNRLAMVCRRGLLSELRISLKGKGKDLKKLLKEAPPFRSRCREGIVDAPGTFRRR
jgi:ribonuclease T2